MSAKKNQNITDSPIIPTVTDNTEPNEAVSVPLTKEQRDEQNSVAIALINGFYETLGNGLNITPNESKALNEAFGILNSNGYILTQKQMDTAKAVLMASTLNTLKPEQVGKTVIDYFRMPHLVSKIVEGKGSSTKSTARTFLHCEREDFSDVLIQIMKKAFFVLAQSELHERYTKSKLNRYIGSEFVAVSLKARKPSDSKSALKTLKITERNALQSEADILFDAGDFVAFKTLTIKIKALQSEIDKL